MYDFFMYIHCCNTKTPTPSGVIYISPKCRIVWGVFFEQMTRDVYPKISELLFSLSEVLWRKSPVISHACARCSCYFVVEGNYLKIFQFGEITPVIPKTEAFIVIQ